MDRRTRMAVVLVAVSVPLFLFPAVAPAADVRVHDTTPNLNENESVHESNLVRVVAYENLSAEGKTLYEKTLHNDGTYRVPLGDGAPDFEYPNETEPGHGVLVIDRSNATGLPPADERHHSSLDLLTTATEPPPLTSPAKFLRLVSLVLSIATLVAGYVFYRTQ